MSISALSSTLMAAISQPKKSDTITAEDSQISKAVGETHGVSSSSKLTEAPDSALETNSNPAQELRDYMNMSYAEKMQWSWMNAHGISKADFAAMTPEEKQKIVDQMREELKSKMGQHQDQKQSISVTA